MSFMRKHKKRILAAQATGHDDASDVHFKTDTAFNSEGGALKFYRLTLAKLKDDIKQLRSLKDIAARVNRKRQLISNYQPYIDRYLESNFVHENYVLSEFMVWLFDIGNMHSACEIAHKVIEQGQPLDERIKRDASDFVADEIFKWADKEHDENRSLAPYFDNALACIKSGKWEVPSQVKAKYFKLHAKTLATDEATAEQLEEAINHFNLAEEIYSKAGVKTARTNAEKALAKLQES